MAQLLKGAPAAAALDERTAEHIRLLKEEGIEPMLALLRVGEKDSDLSYERGAMKRAEKLGVRIRQVVLPENVSQSELLQQIHRLNEDPAVHGVLMFRPLPRSLDEAEACAALAPEKDVDGITPGSMARIYSGKGAGFAPCTARSCMELLKFYGIDPAGKRAAVIGRSTVIGKPVSLLLMEANATVTTCHTRTPDVPAVAREAQLLVAASGQAESIGTGHFRPDQIVLDVGIHYSEEKQKLVGDVRFEEAEPQVAAISPVPGGVGSMTTAVLMAQTVEAALHQTSEK